MLSAWTDQELLSDVGCVVPEFVLLRGRLLLCSTEFTFLVDDGLLEHLSHGWTKLQESRLALEMLKNSEAEC